MMAYATFFGLYEILKSKFVDKSQPTNFLFLMSLASISGVLSWFPAYAFDVCKTKIQLDSFTGPIYKDLRSVFPQILEEEGWRGFTKGLKPCLMKTVFTSAATMGVFEVSMKLMTTGSLKASTASTH